MDEEAQLRAIAERCARFIAICGDHRGVTDQILADRVDAYRDLDTDQRFRVQVMLCRTKGLACMAVGNLFRFYPRADAPPEAHIA